MRWWILLLVVLAGCTQPAGLGGETTQNATENTTYAVPVETQNVTNEELPTPKENTSTPSDEETDIIEEDGRIDITTKGDTGIVRGTVEGVSKEFERDYTDVDALIFEAAEAFDISLYEARLMAYVDGSRFLKPSEVSDAEETISKVEDPSLDVSGVTYHYNSTGGFIRAAGCDLNRSILVFKVRNYLNHEVPIWKDVRPRIKGALVFRFNKVVLDGVYCAGKEVLQPDTTYKCRKSNVDFVETRQGTQFNQEATYSDLQNELVAQIPGESEIHRFHCPIPNSTA